jgi:3-phytase
MKTTLSILTSLGLTSLACAQTEPEPYPPTISPVPARITNPVLSNLPIYNVKPSHETDGIVGVKDVMDDPAIWVHPTDRTRSVVFGCSKSDNEAKLRGGVYCYKMNGVKCFTKDWIIGPQLNANHFSADKSYNNIDVVYNFPTGRTVGGKAEVWDLLIASNRSDRTVDVLRIVQEPVSTTATSENFKSLQLVGRINIGTGFVGGSDSPYGCEAYQFVKDGKNRHFAVISDKAGLIGVYLLGFDATKPVDRQIISQRRQVFAAGFRKNTIEGIVVDSRLSAAYFASEKDGLFRYELVQSGDDLGFIKTDSGVVVDVSIEFAGTKGVLGAINLEEGPGKGSRDIEGLSIYRQDGGKGYLIVSNQGADGDDGQEASGNNSTYVIYNREFVPGKPNAFEKRIRITSNGSIDAVQFTDGQTVSSTNFGGNFSNGVLVVHDNNNGFRINGGEVNDVPIGVEYQDASNLKYVPWTDIANIGTPKFPVRAMENARTAAN